MSEEISDPVAEAARIICGEPNSNLERRLKTDIVQSIGRVKPDIVKDINFEEDVMSGKLFHTLSAPLQGIAIAKVEGALAFYNRIGWDEKFLSQKIDEHLTADGMSDLQKRYHASTIHDLAYVHPKHFEKALGKPGAASLWETLKRLAST